MGAQGANILIKSLVGRRCAGMLNTSRRFVALVPNGKSGPIATGGKMLPQMEYATGFRGGVGPSDMASVRSAKFLYHGLPTCADDTFVFCLTVEQFSTQFDRSAHRHRAQVGLTGFAQVSGLKGDTSIADRARYDNSYIENWGH